MSRVRTGHGPDDWKPEGPGFARTQGYSGTLAIAPSPITRTRVEAGIDHSITKPNEHKRQQWREWKERSRAKRRAARIHTVICQKRDDHRGDCTRPVVLCGHPMKIAKQPCARRRGHADQHMTRTKLDHQREWRRTTWRARQEAA